MKTYTIRLQKYDDLLTIQDKMTWSNTTRILLVFPDHKKIIHSEIDFARILRFSRQKGYQTAAVIRDEESTGEAQNAGLVVFKSIDEAQKAGWKKSYRSNPEPGQRLTTADIKKYFINKKNLTTKSNPTELLISISLILFSVAALAVFFVPGAQVRVQPDREEMKWVIPVTATSKYQPYLSGALIPAKIETLILTGQKESGASGETLVPADFAQGEVSIKNLSKNKLEIPAGTVVVALSDPQKRYQLLEGVSIEAEDQTGVTVKVKSTSPGGKYNADPGTINAIETDFGQNVVVNNDRPVTGGSDLKIKSAAQKDYDLLKQKIVEDLNPKAAESIRTKLQTGEELAGTAVGVSKIVSESKSVPVGQPGDTVLLTLEVEFEGWIIKSSDLENYIINELSPNLPEGFETVPGTIKMEKASAPVIAGDNITWTMTVQEETRQIVTPELARQILPGKGIPQAMDEIQRQIQLKTRPTIDLFPGWWPIMPLYYSRIDITEE